MVYKRITGQSVLRAFGFAYSYTVTDTGLVLDARSHLTHGATIPIGFAGESQF